MKFVKNVLPSFDKQGVTGSSPVSPILIYKELGQVTGEAILKFVTIL
jgi:hypothetical protein